MADSLIPVSDAQAKAIEEALKTLQGLGGFLRETLGTVHSDIVGLLGGDYLKVRRIENLSKTVEKAKKRLEQSRVRTEPPSLSVLLPLVQAAADEDRDELQEIWAGLLAASADPARKRTFRMKFIEIAKQLDPLEAGVLKEIASAVGQASPAARGSAKAKFAVGDDEVGISVANLLELGLLSNPSGSILMSPLGREFLKAVR